MDAAHAYQMDEAEAQRQLRAIPSDQKRHCVSYPGWDQLSWNQRLFVARNPGVLAPAPAPAPRRPPGGGGAGAPRGAQPPAPAAGGGRAAQAAGVRAEEGVPPTNGLLNILLTSRVLRAALPDVRRRALAESVREAATAEAAIAILLENVASSPYLPEERKDPLAELAMTHQFDALAAALQCDQALSPGPTSAEGEFRAIRDMVVAVFTRSRKMAALPAARRRELGAAIHAQTTAESIKMLALSALETSQAFDGAARDMVANDIFDSRYDRLLLPDRFDCEEVPRRAARESGVVYVDVGAGGVGAGGAGAGGAGAGGGGGAAGGAGGGPLPSAPPPGDALPAAEEDEECPVCLGTSPISARLPCRHQFCRECIEDWARRSPGAGCPLCRAPFSVADIGAAIRA